MSRKLEQHWILFWTWYWKNQNNMLHIFRIILSPSTANSANSALFDIFFDIYDPSNTVAQFYSLISTNDMGPKCKFLNKDGWLFTTLSFTFSNPRPVHLYQTLSKGNSWLKSKTFCFNSRTFKTVLFESFFQIPIAYLFPRISANAAKTVYDVAFFKISMPG